MATGFNKLSSKSFLPLITVIIVFIIIVIGLYAMIYSPRYEDTFADGNFRCGKIAIAADGSTINSNVSDQLARANYFLIVEPFSGKYKAIANPFKNLDNGAGIRIAQLLSGETEEAVISKNIGPNVYDILNRKGIKVYSVDAGTAKDVVQQYKDAKLLEADGPTVQQFYGKKAELAGGGGWGKGYYYVCPNCFTRVPCPLNSNGLVSCPNCGIGMNRGFCGLVELLSPPNTTDFNLAGGLGLRNGLGLGPGGNLVCPNCGLVIPHQRGVPCYTVNCPKCGTTMVRQVPANIQTPFNTVANTQNITTGNVPPISTDAPMNHEYRGVCIKCHTIVYSTATNTNY